MSHVLAPEVTINSTPLLLKLCADDFELESLEINFEDLETASESIKEACSISSKAINNAKANILLAYMADPSCKRWLKKEFAERVDCDNGLLAKMASKSKFRFYTNEKLIVEDLENNGEETANEVIAQRTGVPAKIVARVKNKIQTKREDAIAAEQAAVEESLASDKVDSRDAAENPEVAEVSTKAPEVSAETSSLEDGESSESTTTQIETVAVQVKVNVEEEYLREISDLKNKLNEKDREIARLMALLSSEE
jgi:hypothetical protein